MARDLQMLSQDMVMAMDMDMDMVMVVMDMDIMDTMARDLLMLSQVMDIMVMDMVMDMAMDTTDKQHQSFLLCRLEFSEKTRNEVEPQGTSHSYHSKIINKLFS